MPTILDTDASDARRGRGRCPDAGHRRIGFVGPSRGATESRHRFAGRPARDVGDVRILGMLTPSVHVRKHKNRKRKQPKPEKKRRILRKTGTDQFPVGSTPIKKKQYEIKKKLGKIKAGHFTKRIPRSASCRFGLDHAPEFNYYWVLPSFTYFYLVSPIFTYFYLVYLVLPSFT